MNVYFSHHFHMKLLEVIVVSVVTVVQCAAN